MVKLNGQTVRGNWKSRTLKVSGFAVGYAPIITLVAMNWQNYVSTPERTWSLGVSGAILVIIATFSAVGKMKTLLGSGYTTLWIAFGVVSAMMPLIQETQLILGALLAGQTIQRGVFNNLYKREMDKLVAQAHKGEMSKQTNDIQQVVQQAMAEWSGRA